MLLPRAKDIIQIGKLKDRVKDLEKALEDLSFECFGVVNTCAPSIEVYNRTFDVLKDTLDKPQPARN